MLELMPCPFCDSPAKLDTIFDPYVKCMKCGSTGPMCSEPDAAVEAWNIRAASQDISSDNGECQSCVESKCVTGKSCVSLGLDSCKHCKNTGYLHDGNHCQWCSDVIIDEPDFISDHDAKGLEIIAGWLDKDGLIEPSLMLRRIAALHTQQKADRRDAERWRKLESDGVLDQVADVVTHHTKLVKVPAQEWLISLKDATAKVRMIKIPIREIRVRWFDEKSDQKTLRDMIDAALAQRQGEEK